MMTNAERFKQLFGLYATELWSMSEKEFLEWLNMEYVPDTNVGDTISRQTAILEYQRVCHGVACKECPFLVQVTDNLTDCRLERFIHNLPSAQHERKTGKWIEHEAAEIVEGYLISNYECSCCHTWERKNSDYCPECGADMREKKDNG